MATIGRIKHLVAAAAVVAVATNFTPATAGDNHLQGSEFQVCWHFTNGQYICSIDETNEGSCGTHCTKFAARLPKAYCKPTLVVDRAYLEVSKQHGNIFTNTTFWAYDDSVHPDSWVLTTNNSHDAVWSDSNYWYADRDTAIEAPANRACWATVAFGYQYETAYHYAWIYTSCEQ